MPLSQELGAKDAASSMPTPVMGIRTNLLLPFNVGVIVPVDNRITLEGDFQTLWLSSTGENQNCTETQSATISLRYWLNPGESDGRRINTLTGHSVALVGCGGHFDLERDYEGIQGELYGAGIEYAYTFMVFKHLRLQLSLAAGYVHIPWRRYTVYAPGGKLIMDEPYVIHAKKWIGPMKAGIGIVVPILSRTNNQGRQK